MNARFIAGIVAVIIISVLSFPSISRAQDAPVSMGNADQASQCYLPYVTASTSIPPVLPYPWQNYQMTYTIDIGGVDKLWMPVPRKWDGNGMTDVAIISVSPIPDDLSSDIHGNRIAYWDTADETQRKYSVSYYIALSTVQYTIDPNSIGDYDTSGVLYQMYTQPTERIESDHQLIAQKASEIVGGETNPYEQARMIHEWVSTEIVGPGEDGDTALSTLHKGRGGCGGHSFLFVAMLRSLGVPARNVSGLHTAYQGQFTSGSWQDRTLYTHNWSEFYLPNYGWIQSDTSAGPRNFAGIDEPRIILARGEDIKPGHGHPLVEIPWFHLPHSDRLSNSDPSTQTAGVSLGLTVSKRQ